MNNQINKKFFFNVRYKILPYLIIYYCTNILFDVMKLVYLLIFLSFNEFENFIIIQMHNLTLKINKKSPKFQ